MIKKYPIPGEIYKHYKGGLYEIITLAECKERKESVVVYKSLLFGSIYTRLLSDWYDMIDDTNRFELISKTIL